MVLHKRTQFVALYQRFREIVLPRPLPNPPEYKEPPPASLLARGSWTRILEGLYTYVCTWRSPQKEPQCKTDGYEMEVELVGKTGGSKIGAASSAIQYEYGIRIKSLQLALKEFVKGFHEGSRQ